MLQGDGAKIANLITGSKAFVDAKDLKPGMFRKITANDLPKPYATGSNSNTKLAARPAGALPAGARGIQGRAISRQSQGPRQIRIAPQRRPFLSPETNAGEIKIVRGRMPTARPS